MRVKTYQAFTLVELIVVITILSILGTIGFISLQWYTVNARDVNRLSDMSTLSRSLEYYKLKNGLYPNPDSSVSLSASWNLIGYQWFAGTWLLNTIGFSSEGKDPLDTSYYSYYVLSGGSHMQIMWFLENNPYAFLPIGLPYSYATNNNRFAKAIGNQLWIITDIENNPVSSHSGATNIDLIQTNDLYTAHISDSVFYTGSWSELRYSIPRSSCQRLADLNLGWPSGYYTIYPISNIPFEVYCDFSTEGEGLTLIARSVNNSSYNGTPFGWFVSRWSPKDDSQPFSLGTSVQGIPFQKVYLTVYSTGKNITWTTILDVEDLNIFNGSYGTTSINVNSCIGADIWGWTSSCTLFNKWWKFNSATSYWFSKTTSNTSDGLNARRYGATFPVAGMIFVK